jgi:hypothetical protein
MKKFFPHIILTVIVLMFFYQTLVFGRIPFPGDLLLAEDAPWRHASYFGYVPGSIPNKGQYFDVIQEIYPWKTLVINELKHGRLPLWNPYSFSGTPLLANYQSQVLSPLILLYVALPQVTAWTIILILQPLLGGLFLYLYMKKIGRSDAAAIFAAIAWNFSGFASVWMEFTTVWHTILWLPFFLYLFEDAIALKNMTMRHILGLSLGVYCSLTAGHPQDFINTMLYTGIYLLCRICAADGTPKEKFLSLLRMGWPVIIGVGLGSTQIIPTVELFRLSTRVSHDLTHILGTMLFQWWQTPMLVVQDFFGNPATKTYMIADTYVGKTAAIGAAGTTLAIIALFTKKSWHKQFFTGSALVIILLSINSPLTALFYRYPIPLLSTGTPTRNLFILSFALSVLAGIGYDAVSTIQKKKLVTAIGIVLGIYGVLWIVAMLLLKTGIPITSLTNGPTKRAMMLGTAFAFMTIATIIASKKWPKAMVLVVIFLSMELGVAFNKFNPFVPAGYVYPEHPLFTFLRENAGINRAWGYGTGRLNANFTTQEAVFSTDGVDPLNLKWHNEFLQLSNTGTFRTSYDRSSRSDSNILPGYGQTEMMDNPYRLRILDLTGTSYVFTHNDTPTSEKTFPADRFTALPGAPDGWLILKNTKAADRYFLTSTIDSYTSDTEFTKKLFSPDTVDTKRVLVDASIAQSLTVDKTATGSVSLTAYTPTHVEFTTNTTGPMLLFLSDSYAPGWHAHIDERETKVYRVNYAFRGMIVPAGTHTVRMDYSPDSLRIGVIISVCSGLILILTLILTAKNTKSDSSHT